MDSESFLKIKDTLIEFASKFSEQNSQEEQNTIIDSYTKKIEEINLNLQSKILIVFYLISSYQIRIYFDSIHEYLNQISFLEFSFH